jgi:hypothetical protein
MSSHSIPTNGPQSPENVQQAQYNQLQLLQQQQQQAFLVLLKGGQISDIDSLYKAFWAILLSCQHAIKDPKSAAEVLNGNALTQFLELSGTEVKITVPPSVPSISFSRLEPHIQNLIMAVGDANVKLTNAEEVITSELSRVYSQTAYDATKTLSRQIERFVEFDKSVHERSLKMHFAAVQRVLGEDFAKFQIGALQVLDSWSSLSTRYGLSVQINNIETVEGLLEALQIAKRTLETAQHGDSLKSAKSFRETKSDAEKRLQLRLQLDENHRLREKASRDFLEGIDSGNHVLLAKKLQRLQISDEETRAQLLALSSKSHEEIDQFEDSEDKDQIQRNADAKQTKQDIEKLLEQAHILAIQSSALKEAIKKQISNEIAADLDAMHKSSIEGIEKSQIKLLSERNAALVLHSKAISEMQEAVRTIISSIRAYGSKSRNFGGKDPVEDCILAIEKAREQNKKIRDARELESQKKVLHSLILNIKHNLEKIADSSFGK